MQKRYAFVFDLDGTLLNSKKVITQRSLNTLQKAAKLGHKIIIATARPPRYAQNYVDQIKADVSAVFYNGAIHHCENGKSESHCIPRETLRDIVAYIETNDVHAYISIERDDKWYTSNTFDYAGYFNIAEKPLRISKEELIGFSPTKLLVINAAHAADIKEKFKTQCNCLITDNDSLLQIMPLGVSKESAVGTILKELQLGFDNAVCFGDDYNDIGLFQHCKMAVAPENAITELKKLANTTTVSNDKDGIAIFIEEFLSL